MNRRAQSDKPLKWKDTAGENLMEIFSETIRTESISGNFQLSSVEAVMKDMIQVGLCGLERRVQDIARAVVHLDEHGNGLPPATLKKELTGIETFIRRYAEEKLNAMKTGKVYEPLDGKGNEGVHTRALKACYPKLVRDLRVTSTNLLDDLVACDVISLASVSSIQAKPTNRERNEAVLHALQGVDYARFVTAFLPALQKETGNALLAKEIRAAMWSLHGSTATGRGCQACMLRDRVDLRRVADLLLREALITIEEYENLRSRRLSNKEAWDTINSRGHQKRNAITKVLREKYPDVFEEMRRQNIGDLRCPCRRWNFAVQGDDDSDDAPDNSDIARISDVASVAPKTSDTHPSPLPSASHGMVTPSSPPSSCARLVPVDFRTGRPRQPKMPAGDPSHNQRGEMISEEEDSAFTLPVLRPPKPVMKGVRYDPYKRSAHEPNA